MAEQLNLPAHGFAEKPDQAHIRVINDDRMVCSAQSAVGSQVLLQRQLRLKPAADTEAEVIGPLCFQHLPGREEKAVAAVSDWGQVDDRDIARLKGAAVAFTNKVRLGAQQLAELPELQYIGIMATGADTLFVVFDILGAMPASGTEATTDDLDGNTGE